MIFRSDFVNAQWDTWCFYDIDTYYLYYLITEKSPGEGFGVATSSDGIHWKDHGWAISASNKMVHYLGTGSVWKDPVKTGRFLCNYSEWRNDDTGQKRQNILFAWSKDLIHWNKFGDDALFPIDERYYKRYGRWDCIFTMPRGEGGYWGTWTATPQRRESQGGGIGFGYSEDGVHWVAVDPASVESDGDESGAMVRHQGKIHTMFGLKGQMVAYVADGIEGPYSIALKNSLLLKRHHSYFSRYFDTPEGTLVNHHAMDGRKIETGRVITYAAPFKLFTLDQEGIQRWRWWSNNDLLKGETVPPEERTDFQQGLFLEFQAEIHEEAPTKITLEIDGSDYVISIEASGKVRFTSTAAKEDWQRDHLVDRDLPFEGKITCRVLARRGMLELYVNDYFIECWTMGCTDASHIRLNGAKSDLIDDSLRSWRMNLG